MKNMSGIHPLGKQVLFTEDSSGQTTSFGIIIEADKKSSKVCTVVAVGPEVSGIKYGDKFYVDYTKVKPIGKDGIAYGIVSFDEILAVIA